MTDDEFEVARKTRGFYDAMQAIKELKAVKDYKYVKVTQIVNNYFLQTYKQHTSRNV